MVFLAPSSQFRAGLDVGAWAIGSRDMREQFLKGADVVRSALLDQRVVDGWDDPSVLEGQTIGSLAGHLARGSVWAVGDYLDTEPGDRDVDVETAAAYFASVVESVTPEDHVAIRARGAEVAADGAERVSERLDERLAELRRRLPAEPTDRAVVVFGGRVMLLDDYLYTRIVEQVVHLDDLARSIGAEPWTNPPDAAALVVACGAEIGRLRNGDSTMIRAMFRDGAASTLPVL